MVPGRPDGVHLHGLHALHLLRERGHPHQGRAHPAQADGEQPAAPLLQGAGEQPHRGVAPVHPGPPALPAPKVGPAAPAQQDGALEPLQGAETTLTQHRRHDAASAETASKMTLHIKKCSRPADSPANILCILGKYVIFAIYKIVPEKSANILCILGNYVFFFLSYRSQ